MMSSGYGASGNGARPFAIVLVLGLHLGFLLTVLHSSDSLTGRREQAETFDPVQVRLIEAERAVMHTPGRTLLAQLMPETPTYSARVDIPVPEIVLAPVPRETRDLRMASPFDQPESVPGFAHQPEQKSTGDPACLPHGWLSLMSRAISQELRYPRYSRDLGHRGSAQVRMLIGRNGRVMETSVRRGTGHELLDIEAREVARRIGWFQPVPETACPGATIMVVDQPILFSQSRRFTGGTPVFG